MTYKRLVEQGEIPSARSNTVEVQAQLMDETDWPMKGTIDFVDNHYDRIDRHHPRARGAFPIPNYFITPGSSAASRCRCRSSIPVDARSRCRGRDRPVDQARCSPWPPDGTVVPKPVELGPVVDGNLRIVRSGIEPRTTTSSSTGCCARARARRSRRSRARSKATAVPKPNDRWPGAIHEHLAFLHRPADLRRRHLDLHHADRRRRLFRPAGRAISGDRAADDRRSRRSYPGASAEIVAKTVATPIEQEINGVENMLYMTSQSTSDGNMPLTVTFKLGTDLDTAQVLVQNRVAIAQPRLPEEVRRIGVTVTKHSPDLMLVIHLYLARRHARPALHLQLRHAAGEGRAGAARRRRRRDHLRRARLFHAHLARSREARRRAT